MKEKAPTPASASDVAAPNASATAATAATVSADASSQNAAVDDGYDDSEIMMLALRLDQSVSMLVLSNRRIVHFSLQCSAALISPFSMLTTSEAAAMAQQQGNSSMNSPTISVLEDQQKKTARLRCNTLFDVTISHVQAVQVLDDQLILSIRGGSDKGQQPQQQGKAMNMAVRCADSGQAHDAAKVLMMAITGIRQLAVDE